MKRKLLGITLLFAVAAAAAWLWASARMEAGERAALASLDKRLAPERAAWRAKQDEEMKGELSPLARVDYVHLRAGESAWGPGAAVPLSNEALAPYQGDLRLLASPGALALKAAPAVRVNGKESEAAVLKNGDVIAAGRIRLMVAGLPADPSVAVYDQGAPPRVAYKGLHYYDFDSHYTALAQLERYPQPREVEVGSSRGGPQRMLAVGKLSFEVQGTPCSMEVYSQGDSVGLFIIFKDRTNGEPGGSYGAGRFLNAIVTPDSRALLDFNQAWNPLCAYSKYYHCPLPPKSNWLSVAIKAGEKIYDH